MPAPNIGGPAAHIYSGRKLRWPSPPPVPPVCVPKPLKGRAKYAAFPLALFISSAEEARALAPAKDREPSVPPVQTLLVES